MTQLATRQQDGMALSIEQVLIGGDLSALTPDQRVSYYQQLCRSLGLNELTKPFEYLTLDRKLVLYAKRDATDQLRKLHSVSIVQLERERMDDVYVVTAHARTADGREDQAVGAVPITKENGTWQSSQGSGKSFFKSDGTFSPLHGEALANAMMKAETKAKRRVTLSICGLGLLDETEIASVPSAAAADVDHQTGEILDVEPVKADAVSAPGERICVDCDQPIREQWMDVNGTRRRLTAAVLVKRSIERFKAELCLKCLGIRTAAAQRHAPAPPADDDAMDADDLTDDEAQD